MNAAIDPMDSTRHVKNQLYWSDEECRIENGFKLVYELFG